MKKKPTSKEGAADQNAAANASTGESQSAIAPIQETSPFITPQMASCSMFAGEAKEPEAKEE